MASITLRSVKGAPLTNAEVDTNFSNLNTAKIEAASPALTGTPTAPTAAAATNTTQIATTAHVFAERTNTATLTNKTLTSPTINTPTINGGTSNPTTLQENGSPAVVQSDVGTAPNQLPLNQYLGNLAYQDAANIAGNVGVGGALTVVGATTLAAATMASATVTNAVEAGGGAVAEQLVVDNFTASSSAVLRGGSTNLLTYSEAFDDAAWTKSNSTITANTVVAPDGALTGDALIENTATAEHYVQQAYSVGTNAAHSFSVLVKAAGRTVVRLFALGTSFGGVAQAFIFDLSAITATSGNGTSTGSITSVGNGWFRCVMNMPITSSTGALTLRVLPQSGASSSYTGDGTSGLFIWGAQLNTGATPAPYLKTVANAVTTAYAAPIESPNGLALPLLASMTPARNSDMTFELASDTSLVVKVRGADGTVRSTTLTLA
jgi:hypothetical protein